MLCMCIVAAAAARAGVNPNLGRSSNKLDAAALIEVGGGRCETLAAALQEQFAKLHRMHWEGEGRSTVWGT